MPVAPINDDFSDAITRVVAQIKEAFPGITVMETVPTGTYDKPAVIFLAYEDSGEADLALTPGAYYEYELVFTTYHVDVKRSRKIGMALHRLWGGSTDGRTRISDLSDVGIVNMIPGGAPSFEPVNVSDTKTSVIGTVRYTAWYSDPLA